MSFIDLIKKHESTGLDERLNSVTKKDIEYLLSKDILTPTHFLSLLSPVASDYLEDMAKKAHRITLKNFGKAIQLYTPIYISDYCDNNCVYCGFNVNIKRPRKKLTMDELGREARYIADTGLRHVLVLTGSSKSKSPLSYIKECVRVLKKYFSSISIEVYPLTEEEYKELIDEGVDGLTIYQETYNRTIYDKVHVKGSKRDYLFRLDAAERALRKRMRVVNIGALLGLNKWREDSFYAGLHAKYLRDKFPEAEISISVPRIRPQTKEYSPQYEVSDRDITQLILAFRLFLPRIGITLSTRESRELRDNLLPLGITRISADSTTVVGGHTSGNKEEFEQFLISDKRSVSEIRKLLLNRGYQPVLKDWV
jgi:2-iminoacetate synthase